MLSARLKVRPPFMAAGIDPVKGLTVTDWTVACAVNDVDPVWTSSRRSTQGGGVKSYVLRKKERNEKEERR